MSQICQNRFSILPNKKKTAKNLPKTCKLLPKWRNFAKSGHTVSPAKWLAHLPDKDMFMGLDPASGKAITRGAMTIVINTLVITTQNDTNHYPL